MIVCEVCGNKAVALTTDQEEIEPVRGPDGKLWTAYKKTGEHFRCAEHPYFAYWEYFHGKYFYRAAPSLSLGL